MVPTKNPPSNGNSQSYQQRQLDFSSRQHNLPPLPCNSVGSVRKRKEALPSNYRAEQDTSPQAVSQTSRSSRPKERLLNYLNKGIISKLDSKITDLREQIPLLVKETVQLNRTQLGSRSWQTPSQASSSPDATPPPSAATSNDVPQLPLLSRILLLNARSISPAATISVKWKVPFIANQILDDQGSPPALFLAITESWLKPYIMPRLQ